MNPIPILLLTLGKLKKQGQVLAGFALETDNEVTNAQEKLGRKNFDFIVLNSLHDKGSGFNSDTNKITIIGKDNKITRFELKSKHDVAVDIIHYFENLLHAMKRICLVSIMLCCCALSLRSQELRCSVQHYQPAGSGYQPSGI